MIDQDLLAYVAQLGTAAADRVHLGNAPQGTPLPCVVLRRTPGPPRPKVLSGASLFSRSQFAAHVLTHEYATAYPIARAIHDGLHGYVGLMGATPIKWGRCVRPPSDESEIDGDKVIRWVAMEFLFMHSEV